MLLRLYTTCLAPPPAPEARGGRRGRIEGEKGGKEKENGVKKLDLSLPVQMALLLVANSMALESYPNFTRTLVFRLCDLMYHETSMYNQFSDMVPVKLLSEWSFVQSIILTLSGNVFTFTANFVLVNVKASR
ncbi:unnamed protein product [Prorocentrum cordatum]|uniref:Dymeclin n=1 Tax=Prorocentrum cordatum TaxID=2364126 RepID=A0ABN9UAN1_9DINO|nr:unnamed protein product [Polarella glacialis]